MAEWDSAAASRLEQVADELRLAEVVDVVREEVRGTWLANLERYEPRELGDTPQLLGLLCAGNISQRVARRCAAGSGSPASKLKDQASVRASLPDGSLLVEACGVELQVRKAPGENLQPDWKDFSWQEADGVRRHAAAAANSRAYRPAASDQDGRPPALPDGLWALEDPQALRHVIVVWAGAAEGELTAGWLGFPCLGNPGWFAITPLWRDTAGQQPGAGRTPADHAIGPADTFADRPEPTLGLSLRKQPGREQQP